MEKIEPCTCSCDVNIIHSDVLADAKEKMAPEETLYDLADLFKTLGDSTRMKIVFSLLIHEMCVCDISAHLNMTQSAISHQLKILKQAKLVKNRKEGKIVYYSLDDEHIKDIVAIGLAHIGEK